MITKTFICDLCKKSVGETELIPLDVNLSMPKSPSGYTQRLTAKRDICKECLKAKGIVTEITDEKQRETVITKSQKTFEEKFVDMLADLGVAFCD